LSALQPAAHDELAMNNGAFVGVYDSALIGAWVPC
jgi:hypothetical protein